jgi:hypothetical protein
MDMRLGDCLEGLALLVPMALALSGCGWTELDAIAQDGVEDAAGAQDDAAPLDASMAPPDSEASSVACSGNGETVDDWTFDSDVEGWALALDTDVVATLGWTGSTGHPSLGALQVEVKPSQHDGGAANGGWLKHSDAYGDLSGRTVSAWVWLESGETPNLKVFAQTGTQYVWSDNGTVHLRPKTWTCVSLPISTPSYNQPGYDPTDVVDIGFELLGSSSFEVYVDTVRIY